MTASQVVVDAEGRTPSSIALLCRQHFEKQFLFGKFVQKNFSKASTCGPDTMAALTDVQYDRCVNTLTTSRVAEVVRRVCSSTLRLASAHQVLSTSATS